MSQLMYDQLLHSATGLNQGVLRDVLIPSILGDETSGILYWAGKDLAHQFPVSNSDQLTLIFEQLGFGQLTKQKSSAKQQVWLLDGPIVAQRLKNNHPDFNLEAGFIAQQIEFQTNAITEAQITEQKKGNVQITVQSDLKDPSLDTEAIEFLKIETPTPETTEE
ncbi:YslB family protein [Paucilactobacillus kaifaensis]|uniref:YslB family protein n=1 Tax=Paucilactobacillus kaifaensis TaxID=2559921 RepID=UPI0010F5DDC6|nr:YslB family protein [Paucilactobacillus kaifaensis]